MRFYLNTTPSTNGIPFDHLHQLIGCIHKWVGPNQIHDEVSLYCFGWLQGSRVSNGKLHFPDGARWFISGYDIGMMTELIKGINQQPEMFSGMRVDEVRMRPTPEFPSEMRFPVAGPVFIRRNNDDGSRQHILYDDPESSKFLTRTLRRRLMAAGLTTEDHLNTKVEFDTGYQKARTKKVRIKNIDQRASLCPIIVKGTPEAVQFAWDVGVGELTGSGFGALN